MTETAIAQEWAANFDVAVVGQFQTPSISVANWSREFTTFGVPAGSNLLARRNDVVTVVCDIESAGYDFVKRFDKTLRFRAGNVAWFCFEFEPHLERVVEGPVSSSLLFGSTLRTKLGFLVHGRVWQGAAIHRVERHGDEPAPLPGDLRALLLKLGRLERAA